MLYHTNLNNIESLIEDLSKDPLDPEKNFYIAIEYERLNQTASAVSFYLRAIEYGYKDFPNLAYTALLKIAICFEDQKDRNLTVSNAILQAISLIPFRPEAYFLMSRFYEKNLQWQESYVFASLGLHYTNEDDLKEDVLYRGRESLLFQKAISAWWIGRQDESKVMLIDLYKNKEKLNDLYLSAVLQNLVTIGVDYATI